MEGPPDLRTRIGICFVVWLMAGLLLLSWHPEPPLLIIVLGVIIGPLAGFSYQSSTTDLIDKDDQ